MHKLAYIIINFNSIRKDGTEDYTSLWRMTFGEKKDEYFSEAFKVEQIVKPQMRNGECICTPCVCKCDCM